MYEIQPGVVKYVVSMANSSLQILVTDTFDFVCNVNVEHGLSVPIY